MRPRVTYWTGTWDPAREAISKEIEALRTTGGRQAPVVSFSPGQRSGIGPGARVLRLSARRWLALRAIAPVVERRGDVTHVFGGVGSWHLLRSVGRRPLLLTVAVPAPPVERAVLDKVRLFAVESPRLATQMQAAGISADRIELVYPGVDLTTFAPAPLPPEPPFRIVFASSPADVGEFEARGIPLLVEIARRASDVEVVLVWRRWGSLEAARRALDRLRPPANVTQLVEPPDLVAAYRQCHAVACLYEEDFGKSCPNSVIEALACGRPALVARSCGIAAAIEDGRAGVAVDRTIEGALHGLATLRRTISEHARNARALAEQLFDIRATVATYNRLYERLAADPASRPSMLPRSSTDPGRRADLRA